MSSPYPTRMNGSNGQTPSELLEDTQNGQHNTSNGNNWPFSVRYTASPYRKAKYAPQMHSSSMHSPMQIVQGGGAPLETHQHTSNSNAQTWTQVQSTGGHPHQQWHQLHHGSSQTPVSAGHFITPISYKLNQYVHSHEVQLHHHHHLQNIQQVQNFQNFQSAVAGNNHHHQLTPQQLQQLQQVQNANHFLELKQHQEHQQQLIHQHQRQYDHHHYGLPVSAIPPQVILQASQATLNKTMGIVDADQHTNLSTGGIANGAFIIQDKEHNNQHFKIRYPHQQALLNGMGAGGRKRVIATNFNQCNTQEQVEGLDEGYIEELKQPMHLSGSSGHSELGHSHDSSQLNSARIPSRTITNFDPYSYVYDSQLIKEDLSVCSASVNQVFLHKPPYQHPPEGYSHNGHGHNADENNSGDSGNGYKKPALETSHCSEIENEYEEIRDVQRYMNINATDTSYTQQGHESVVPVAVGSVPVPVVPALPVPSESDASNKEEILSTPLEKQTLAPKHFKSFSTSTDDILAEVVQVKRKHDRVLDQLNLEVENLLLNSSKEISDNVNQSTGNGSSFDNFALDLNGSGSYSNLIVTSAGGNGKIQNGSWMDPLSSTVQCPFGGSLRRSTFNRKAKLDRGFNLNNFKDQTDFTNSGMNKKPNAIDKGKMINGNGGECCGDGNMSKMKSKYQRSMSLIPNWKIRDHLMRLPFLRHHHDKTKKGDCGGGIPHSHTISGAGEFQQPQNQSSNKHNIPVGGLGKTMSTTTTVTTTNNGLNNGTITAAEQQQTPTTLKTRSSSMDELRSTGEEHWYSADSDTDPDSLTAIPPLPPAHSPPLNQPISTISVSLNVDNNKVLNGGDLNIKISGASANSNNSVGNLYSNCGDCNGSRMDVAINNPNITNGIPDAPKAPKFRRPAGLKDKWRESWSLSTKTLTKSSSMEEDNRLLRWFSLRKNSASMDPSATNGSNRHSTLPQLTEEDLKRISFMEDEEGYWPRRTVQPPSLPPPPPELSGEQLTRRHIIAAIVHSENSYVAALQRLVNEYKKPLECSHPAILSHSKISAVFHRVPEILQCHSLFRIALAECVRKWDLEEKIGDVFVASFSKSLVLDVYSEFINNFGTAMETAKVEARRKSAFAEFLKVKQMTAHDRLSLFGLMVKPVQRFPQFILLLQDLLKHTPKDHHDRMSLQLALTQLESLAAMLNERKRESEQYLAFRETIKSIGGGKFVLLRSIVDDPNRILLRQDIVTQLEFDTSGSSVSKSKCRKLLLLNDMLICTTSNSFLTPQSSTSDSQKSSSLKRMDSSQSNHEDASHLSRGKSDKSLFKWSHPVQNVEVEDISISPTMSRFVHRSSSTSSGNHNNVHNSSGESTTATSITLLEEMQSLMHDYEVLSRILGLVSSLKTNYEGLSISSVKDLMLEIQHQIRQRDEQISYFDSSCLTLLLGSGNNREKLVFQMQSPQARSAWIEELRLAQLALDSNNSPGWDIPQESPYPLHKLPLFVKAVPLSKQPHLTIVKCGCFFTHTTVSQTGRSKIFDYLWVSSTDGMSSHLTAFRSQQNTLKEVTSLDLLEEKVNDMLFVKGNIWVATESRKIMIFDPNDTEKGSICQQILTASVLKLLHYNNTVYAGLADGHVAIFTQLNPSTVDNLSPEILLQVGSDRIVSLFGSKESVYAACGNTIIALKTNTHNIERSVVLNHHNGPISHMACSGVGLWITTLESETVCLYHLESFQHLQDVSIRPSVYRTVRDNFRRSKGVFATSLIAHKGWLWIGTNLGVVLTIPLPRLEGVPIISTGNANVSFHGFCGPVTFLMPLMNAVQPPPVLNSVQNKPVKEVKVVEFKNPTDEISPNKTPSVLLKDDPHQIPEDAPTSPLSIDIDVADNSTDPKNLLPTPKSSSELPNGVNTSSSSIENCSPSPNGSATNPNKTLVVLRKKSSKDNVFMRNCKTLPRGTPIPTNLRFSIDSDVYGLYGNLINVRGLEDEGRFVDPLYDALRRSDPELNALDAKISTLDRRLKMRMSRPRSLDLSNWSVDSKISASSEDSVGERGRGSGGLQHGQISDSSPIPPDSKTEETDSKLINENKSNTITTNRKGTHHRTKGNKSGNGCKSPEKTVFVVVGGRGYLNMRSLAQEHFLSTSSESETKSCPHLTLWQMKT